MAPYSSSGVVESTEAQISEIAEMSWASRAIFNDSAFLTLIVGPTVVERVVLWRVVTRLFDPAVLYVF